MALLGTGALANFHDVPPEHDGAFNAWHTTEHLPERLAVPGFARGRRYVAIEGAPRYFILYETENVEVLASAPYLERLNDPTPRTREVSRTLTLTWRTGARVSASAGEVIGDVACPLRFAPAPGQAAALREWIAAETLPRAMAMPGVTGAHLLEADRAVTGIETTERYERRSPDRMDDWILVVEGRDEASVDAALPRAETLQARGAVPGPPRALYGLQVIMTAP